MQAKGSSQRSKLTPGRRSKGKQAILAAKKLNAGSSMPEDGIGGLKSFGVYRPEQVPLLLPDRWEDNRSPMDLMSHKSPKDKLQLYVCHTVPEKIVSRSDNNGHYIIALATGVSGYTSQEKYLWFRGEGAALTKWKLLYKTVKPKQFFIRGMLTDIERNGRAVVIVTSVIPDKRMEKVQPLYPGRGLLGRDTLTDRVAHYIDSIDKPYRAAAKSFLGSLIDSQNLESRKGMKPAKARAMVRLAAAHLLDGLDGAGDDVSKARLVTKIAKRLEVAHGDGFDRGANILSIEQNALEAQGELKRLAAFGQYLKARQNTPATASRSRFSAAADWGARANALPFVLTDEQQAGVARIVTNIRRGAPVRYVITGDVGTGKTYVYALVAMSIIDGGGRAQVLFPSQALAIQVYEEMTDAWPDLLGGKIKLLIGSGAMPIDGRPLSEAALILGTTAIIAKTADIGLVDLVVVDEQQKFAVRQREFATSNETHLIEASATCIPRSQALLEFGAVNIVRLTKAHSKKTIHTHIVEDDKEAKRGVLARCRKIISEGGQVLAVYPAKDDSNPSFQLLSVEGMRGVWEKVAPGRVAIAHGGRSTEENQAAVAAMKNGEMDVLVCTTIIEVGMTFPQCRHVVVAHPERLGLSSLHQLRGRLVRRGGVGYFDMIIPDDVSSRVKVHSRLSVLVESMDGFEIAEKDLEIRGGGDLALGSMSQRGKDYSFLPNINIEGDDVQDVIAELKPVMHEIEARLSRMFDEPSPPPEGVRHDA